MADQNLLGCEEVSLNFRTMSWPEECAVVVPCLNEERTIGPLIARIREHLFGIYVIDDGSTDRSPYPQAGYIVCFIPFENGKANGEWEVFADGFTGVDTVVNTSDAVFRPMGLATGPASLGQTMGRLRARNLVAAPGT